MEDRAALGHSSPDVVEVLAYESGETRLSRLALPGRTIVRKQPLGPDAAARLRHEVAMLERVRGVTGVAHLVDEPQLPGSIFLVDAGKVTLADLGKPLAVDQLVGLALAITDAVAAIHRLGVLHRDIAPANIVIADDGAPCLVDFALATSVLEVRPEFTHHNQVLGTLAYLAPEQTGRTGRPVDQRADLYALGATLYEAATGAPPFGTGDPLQLTHAHLARVPTPPARVNAEIPDLLDEIILHLLEKEPDRRYQSADGLLHDLRQLRVPSQTRRVQVGERDVQLRLQPPSRLVGRDEESAALEAAFEDALDGRCRGVVISGPPGVGKTALVNELRAVVTRRDGWFVAGKFDQYRGDLESNGVHQAFSALGRLLLPEPEDEVAEIRARILSALGANAGLVTASSAIFAALLGSGPDPGDPLTAQGRVQRAGVDMLRAIATRSRPIVFFVDDLQWADRTPLGFLDILLTEEPIEGLLLVGAYRDGDVPVPHPLATSVVRWRDQAGVRHLLLGGLPASALVTMVAEVLHVQPDAAAGLVDAISPAAAGNPYEILELLNALRHDGLLTATAGQWRWDPAVIRGRAGQHETTEPLAGRVEAMPELSRRLVEAMACLGGRAELRLLRIATGVSARMVDQALAPAVEEGLLVVEPGRRSAVRFRHDRAREAILDGLTPGRQRFLQLAMARRLAAVPDLFAVAAGQYLPVLEAVDAPDERRAIVALMRRSAAEASLIGDHEMVEKLLGAALRLIDPDETGTLIEVHSGRHAALYSVGRLDDADEEYRTIEALSTCALDLAAATGVQVSSLTGRNHFAEAVGLGIDVLRQLGVTVPPEDQLEQELDQQFDYLYRWLEYAESADALTRPDITDPVLLAATRLVNTILPPAYYAAPTLLAWLGLDALRIWLEDGPGATLVGPASLAAFAVMALRGDDDAGYRAGRRIVELGEARGYEPATSHARLVFAQVSCWFEPLENGVRAGRLARKGLIAGGDLANGGYTYYPTVVGLLESAESLGDYAAEVKEGLTFGRRTGSEQSVQWLETHQWLADVLHGGTAAALGDVVPVERYADNPLALCFAHLNHAVAAAIFGDGATLSRHSADALPLLPAVLSYYPSALARLLRGLALAERARSCEAEEMGTLLFEIEELTEWLAQRAENAPENFLHLQRFLEAEWAWAASDFRAAAVAFDAAQRESARTQRRWHRALITEHAARFYLAHGIEQLGHDLLGRARRDYLEWGAAAKAEQLDEAFPSLRSEADATGSYAAVGSPPPSSAMTTGSIDLLGILSASQALSSETSIQGLYSRVVEVLGSLTGATDVLLLMWNGDRQEWVSPQAHDVVPGAGSEAALPTSVLRYVQRTAEPLVAADATVDDRFIRDEYFAGLACCSLLAAPIFSRGALCAVLVLQNRLTRDAFSTDRLDAVELIAGQLAVSLDNAQLYGELSASRARIVTAADAARRRIERDLHDGAQQRLVTFGLRLRVARAAVPAGAEDVAAQLDDMADEVYQALEELREISRGIHPATLAEGGLAPALKSLARRSAIPVRLKLHVDRRLPDPIEIAVYYSITEALTNVAKHAEATFADVEVDADGRSLRIEVRDDGRGGANLVSGSGLVGIQDRIQVLGGRLTLDSQPGAGTTLRIALPLA